MKRRLLNLLTAASLMLCVFVSMLWLRSWAVRDEFGAMRGRLQRNIATDFGRLTYFVFVFDHAEAEWDYGWRWRRSRAGSTVPVSGPFEQFSSLGFAWRVVGTQTIRLNGKTYHVAASESWMPLWPIVVLTAALPLARARRAVTWTRTQVHCVRGRRRLRLNQCPACGYDLRATPGRCPECGTAPKVGTTASVTCGT